MSENQKDTDLSALKNAFSERLEASLEDFGYLRKAGKGAYTFVSFAEKIGVTKVSLYNMLAGKTIPSPDVILKISKELKVCPCWLVYGLSRNENQIDEEAIVRLVDISFRLANELKDKKAYEDCIKTIIKDVQNIPVSANEKTKFFEVAASSILAYKKSSNGAV